MASATAATNGDSMGGNLLPSSFLHSGALSLDSPVFNMASVSNIDNITNATPSTLFQHNDSYRQLYNACTHLKQENQALHSYVKPLK